MRKFFYGLGIFFCVLVVVVGGSLGYVAYKGSNLDRDAKSYVDEVVPIITAHWSADELEQRVSPAFAKATKPEDLHNLFVVFEKLGPLQNYEGSKGQASMFMSVGGESTVSATYTAQAKYENGEATIDIGLVKVNDVWRIQSFRVNSAAMIERTVGKAI